MCALRTLEVLSRIFLKHTIECSDSCREYRVFSQGRTFLQTYKFLLWSNELLCRLLNKNQIEYTCNEPWWFKKIDFKIGKMKKSSNSQQHRDNTEKNYTQYDTVYYLCYTHCNMRFRLEQCERWYVYSWQHKHYFILCMQMKITLKNLLPYSSLHWYFHILYFWYV